MPKTVSFTPSHNFLLTCFMLVLVVFSTTMRFAGLDGLKVIESNFISLSNVKATTEIDNSLVDNCKDKSDQQNLSSSDNKQEKAPQTLKTAHSSDALLQGVITTELFQNVILTPLIEFVFPSFSFQKIDSVTYYFSSSTFFKTLFSCFISPNAP